MVLFKGGAGLNNYRGSTLLRIFGTFFLDVLLGRLNSVISHFDIFKQHHIGL